MDGGMRVAATGRMQTDNAGAFWKDRRAALSHGAVDGFEHRQRETDPIPASAMPPLLAFALVAPGGQPCLPKVHPAPPLHANRP